MADDRPANDDLAAVVATLRRELDDLRSTALARTSRCATGTIEATPLVAPKPDTVFLQGQTLQRSDYPVLWQWIADNSPGGFTTTPTTLTLPDWRGRTPVGATAARPPGTQFGAATSTLGVANLPSHDHGGGTNSASTTHTHAFSTDYQSTSHSHTLSVDGGGNHSGHNTNAVSVGAPAAGSTVVLYGTTSSPGGNPGSHGHSGVANVREFGHDHSGATAASNASHSHTIPAQGSGTAFNTEDPAVSLNWMLWV